VAERVQPELELWPVDLEVPLHAPCAVAGAERLVAHAVACREQRGTGGWLERVHVPLEDHVAVAVVAEQRVGGRGRIGPHDLEPHLAVRGLADLRVERPCQDLRAEADPQERDLPLNRLQGQLPYLFDERLLLRVLHVVRAAEQHHAVHVRQIGTAASGSMLSHSCTSAPPDWTASGASPNVSTVSQRTNRIGFIRRV
jgi:hypothetical protein